MATRKKAVVVAVNDVQSLEGSAEQLIPEATPPQKEDKGLWSHRTRWLFMGLMAMVFVCAVIAGYLVYRTYATSSVSSDTSAEEAARETQVLLDRVGTLIILPANETPVIYEVNDPAILINQQPFFAGAEQGDKLIIYPNAVKAILYSPSRHVLINVGPITFNESNLPSQ